MIAVVYGQTIFYQGGVYGSGATSFSNNTTGTTITTCGYDDNVPTRSTYDEIDRIRARYGPRPAAIRRVREEAARTQELARDVEAFRVSVSVGRWQQAVLRQLQRGLLERTCSGERFAGAAYSIARTPKRFAFLSRLPSLHCRSTT